VADPPYAEATPEEARQDVRRLAATVDYVIVSLHWGEEFVDRPSTAEVEHARSLIDAGADLLVGHHPHVVRPLERHGKGLIAYSLGNFVGDMIWQEPLRRGAILRCVLAPDGVEDVRVTRTYVDDNFKTVIQGEGSDHLECSDPVQGLEEDAYREEVARTVRSQRLATYKYAAANWRKFQPGMLAQLVGRTVRNKLRSGS
jgi:poly-gamma-glutamate synthesis protein (capsule biosynthesis protein)